MLLDNGGRVVTTIDSLFTRPAGAGGNGDDGAGRRSDSGSSSSGSGAWRPRRVVIFQASSHSPEEDARVLDTDLASAAEVELSRQALASEGARARGGGAGPDSLAVEVVKPIWLVDSVGCFRVLRPSVHHRLPTFGEAA